MERDDIEMAGEELVELNEDDLIYASGGAGPQTTPDG